MTLHTVPDIVHALVHELLPTGLALRWRGEILDIFGRPGRRQHQLTIRGDQAYISNVDGSGYGAPEACNLDLNDPQMIDKLIEHLARMHELPE